jgi:hypothetical protein
LFVERVQGRRSLVSKIWSIVPGVLAMQHAIEREFGFTGLSIGNLANVLRPSCEGGNNRLKFFLMDLLSGEREL